MTAARDALQLPLIYLTVVLAGGIHVAERVTMRPPSLFGLVLGILLLALLVRSGTLAPERLVHSTRSGLANLNGLIVIITVVLASAQAFTLGTPDSGLPRVLVSIFLVILLLNTLAATPDRPRLLRSLLVIIGSAFTLKFIVLAALSDPAGGRMARVMQVLFEGVTLGMVSQEAVHPVTSYLAFATFVLFLIGIALLPDQESRRLVAGRPGTDIANRF